MSLDARVIPKNAKMTVHSIPIERRNMKDDLLPKSVGETTAQPAGKTSPQEELAARVDALFAMSGRAERPSDWLTGAMFVSQTHLRSNPEWVAQAAHSLREILYRLCSPRMGGGNKAIRDTLTKFGSAQEIDISIAEMNDMYAKLCTIAHHEKKIEELNEGNFENLLAAFEKVMNGALQRQLDVYEEIDEILG